jgi:hypothetical protein
LLKENNDLPNIYLTQKPKTNHAAGAEE